MWPMQQHFCSYSSEDQCSRHNCSHQPNYQSPIRLSASFSSLKITLWLASSWSENWHPDGRWINFGWIRMRVSSYKTILLTVYRAVINLLITPNRNGVEVVVSIDGFGVRNRDCGCTAWTLGWDYRKITGTTNSAMVSLVVPVIFL